VLRLRQISLDKLRQIALKTTDEVAKTREVDILCGYLLTSFQREQEGHIYQRICAEHSAVLSQRRG
jgi:hypothetical protein